MLFNIAVKHGGPWLLVVGSGPAEFCDLAALVDVAARLANAKSYRCVLADLLAVDPQLTQDEFARIGRYVATALDGLDRVAAVVARDRSTTESAANQAGFRLRMFSDLHTAEAWLASEAHAA
ncbi:hypothetical protein [Ramlibacter humi]|uniref:STAS/SEC14 domain-containing protein n=1 Tax=Ramlibacter humi TaxID=2530451 RepID=A0A4Z0CBC8_9BURK|nr:hypothetical protein [Ramlibacter humi]TFZ08314.1 hypothetical protein EZ216_03910 [Ramlibacter humi]